MNATRHSLLLSALLLSFLGLQFCRAQVIDLDPRHPEWIEFPRSAIWWNDSLRGGDVIRAGYYSAWGLGDIDNSGTDDFVLSMSVARKGSAGDTVAGTELWVYKGVRDGMPEPRSYQRVGPTELVSNTTFLAAGDWDGDGDRDLCVNISLVGDTSNGNQGLQYTIYRVVIFWNNGTGEFSLADTTRLPNPVGLGNDVWANRISYGRSTSFSGDKREDLLLRGGGAFVGGQYIPTAGMYLYQGIHGGQWGRNGVSAKPVWGWWNVPTHDRVSILDQNCDGRLDLVFYNDSPWENEDDLRIYYGSANASGPEAFDTLDMEHFSFTALCGETTFALLEDLTSDNIPDLVLTCHDWLWRVYAGQPGKRLSEVYGSGADPADPGNGYPDARPWAKIEMPGLLRGGFGSPYEGPLFALGDADLDGWNDLWTTFYAAENGPNIVAYRTGPGFDMLIDGHAYFGGELQHVNLLGDIDGTGNPTRIIINGYRGKQQIIQFFKSSTDLPTHAYDYPRTPPSGHKTFEPTGNRCTSSVGVASEEFQTASGVSLGLRVVPNPSSGEVRVVWEREKRGKGETEMVVHDLSGATVYRTSLSSERNEFLWNTAGLPTGVYYVTITTGDRQQTVQAIRL